MLEDNDPPAWPEFSAKSLRALVTMRWRLIVTTFLAFAVVASVAVAMIPAKYEGTMKFLVRKARADMVVTSDRSSALSTGDVSEAEMNSEIELLNAKDVLEQVAARTLLASEKAPVSAERQEKTVRQLEKNLAVLAVRKANVISVAYTADRPEVALEVLRQVSALYLEKHLAAHRTPGAYTFFKAQTDHYKQELRQAQSQLSEFRLQGGAVQLENQKDLLIRRSSELQAQTAEVNAAVNEVRARITRLEEAAGAMENTVLSQTRTLPNQYSAERLTTLLAEMKNRRTQLLMKFQPEDRTIKEVDQQIADTAATLEAVEAQPTTEQTTTLSPIRESLIADLSKARVQLVGLMARRQTLAGEDAGLWKRATSLEASTPQHDALGRELKAAEANYQLYEAKSEEARIAEALDQEKITNVSVAQEPVVPRLPSSPNRAKLLAVGLAVALLMSVGTAAGTEYLYPGAGADLRSAAEINDSSIAVNQFMAEPAAYANARVQPPSTLKVGRVYDAMQASAKASASKNDAAHQDRSISGFEIREH